MDNLTFLLDADDFLLRTGQKKVEYLRKHFSNFDLPNGRNIESIQPYECSQSLLIPLIGLENYKSMTNFVYSKEGTLQISPQFGALKGVQELNRLGKIYVATSRRPGQAENVKEWSKINNFEKYFEDVSSTKDQKYEHIKKVAGSKKVGIALYLGASMFVDDDPRHMPNEKIDGLHCLLFGEAPRTNIQSHIQIARNWSDVIAHAKKLISP